MSDGCATASRFCKKVERLIAIVAYRRERPISILDRRGTIGDDRLPNQQSSSRADQNQVLHKRFPAEAQPEQPRALTQ